MAWTAEQETELLYLLELEKQDQARSNLLDFTTYTFPAYEVNWHHKNICRKLDDFVAGKIRRLMIFCPPRNGKSELVSRRLPAYILGRFPEASIISASYSSDLASMMNRDVQRIIDEGKYITLFPDTGLAGTKPSKINYIRNSDMFEIVGHSGSYRAAGVGTGITGMGFHYGIIDDCLKNRQEAESKTIRDGVWDWYTSTFYTRQEKDAAILITLTRWHEDDLAGRLLKLAKEDPGADQWEVIEYPAVLETPSGNDPRKPGDALWPGKYNRDVLDKIKATIGSYDWTALYQQNPTPAGGNMIKREWWKRYKEPPAAFDEVIQSWDCAFKDLQTSDYVVGQVWGRIGANKYLLDQIRAKMDTPATMTAIRMMSAKWPMGYAKLIEDKANGPAVIQMLSGEIPGLIAVNPQGGKVARVSSVLPDIEAGNVYVPENGLGDEFIDECSAFPSGKNDDQVDCMSQALFRLKVIYSPYVYDNTQDSLYADGEGPDIIGNWYHRYFSIGYGTTTPFCILEIIEQNGFYYVDNEYYWEPRRWNRSKTDNEYIEDIRQFIKNKRYSFGGILISPEIQSLKILSRRAGFPMREAEDNLLDGIRLTATLLKINRLKINKDRCPNLIAEFAGYVWDARGKEEPVGICSALNGLRYFCKTIVKRV